MGKHISIVEDEADLADLLKYIFIKEGCRVSVYTSGEECLENLSSQPTDLIILDLMLQGMTGLEVCKTIKSNNFTSKIPIIILSARSDEFDVLNGLEVGCDDYMTKPFSKKILLAKIKNIFRKNSNIINTNLVKMPGCEDLEFNTGTYEVFIGGKPLNLTALEFKVFNLLSSSPNKVFTREEILDNIYLEDTFSSDRSVDIVITKIRKKIKLLGSEKKYIESIYGVGYKFKN